MGGGTELPLTSYHRDAAVRSTEGGAAFWPSNHSGRHKDGAGPLSRTTRTMGSIKGTCLETGQGGWIVSAYDERSPLQ